VTFWILLSAGNVEVSGLLLSEIAGMLVPPKDLITLLGINDHQLKRAQEAMSSPVATQEQFGEALEIVLSHNIVVNPESEQNHCFSANAIFQAIEPGDTAEQYHAVM
jgi:hypothetical protein